MVRHSVCSSDLRTAATERHADHVTDLSERYREYADSMTLELKASKEKEEYSLGALDTAVLELQHHQRMLTEERQL